MWQRHEKLQGLEMGKIVMGQRSVSQDFIKVDLD